MLQDVLEIGGKIDVRVLQQDVHKPADGKRMPMMVSQLEAVEDDNELIIQMPMYKGKMVLLTVGARYELVFYTKKGLYQAVGQVLERYKEEQLFMLKVALRTKLKKYQRREYFRLPCILSMEAYELPREEVLKLSNEQLELRILDVDILMTEAKAIIVDISGGGIRFVGEKKYEEGQCLVIHTFIKNETIEQELIVGVSIVSCTRAPSDASRYEARAEFLHLGERLREIIIKYIFDEDRKIRKKDIGV